MSCEFCATGAADDERAYCDVCGSPLNATSGVFVRAARLCDETGVYESSCCCKVRMAFADGDPFTDCPRCEHKTEWRVIAARESAQPADDRRRGAGHERRDILFVSDDDAVRSLVKRLRRARTADCSHVRSATEACRAASAASFDVAVIDFRLRDASGVELGETLLHSRSVDAVIFVADEASSPELCRATLLGVVVFRDAAASALLYAVHGALSRAATIRRVAAG
jgi:CheY-like chemotaxis protein